MRSRGAERGRNTVYVIRLDEVVFCHLGDLGHELDTHQIEDIGSIDVLFVPAYSTLTPAKLTEVISAIEPGLSCRSTISQHNLSAWPMSLATRNGKRSPN